MLYLNHVIVLIMLYLTICVLTVKQSDNNNMKHGDFPENWSLNINLTRFHHQTIVVYSYQGLTTISLVYRRHQLPIRDVLRFLQRVAEGTHLQGLPYIYRHSISEKDTNIKFR